MSELIQNINRIQNTIVIITQLLMSGKTAEPIRLLPSLTQMLSEVMPKMIQKYQELGIENHLENIEYWRKQIERITVAIEGDDYFRLIDVLYFETRENLEEFKKMI